MSLSVNAGKPFLWMLDFLAMSNVIGIYSKWALLARARQCVFTVSKGSSVLLPLVENPTRRTVLEMCSFLDARLKQVVHHGQ